MPDPPIVADVALVLARRYHAPLVVISQDVFPEIAVELRRLQNPVATRLLRALVDLVIFIIGTGARHAELVALAELLEADQVQFLYYQERGVLPQSLSAADIHVVGLAPVAGWNAYKYPSGAGYDVREHREYADLLIHRGEIPGAGKRSEYYTPPGFYALAGVATLIGEHVHSGDPHKLGQVLNWIVLLATAGVLWLLVRELFQRRPWLQLSALAFFCFLPVVLRVGAMFHPEPLSMLLTAVV